MDADHFGISFSKETRTAWKIFDSFEIYAAQGEECCRGEDVAAVVMGLSLQKAAEVEQTLFGSGKDFKQPAGGGVSCSEEGSGEDYLVIGADTVVAYDGRILGKPAGEADAKRMLEMLSGQKHQVYTGVTWICMQNGRRTVQQFAESIDVFFYPMEAQEMDFYIRTGEPMDKAGTGSYGIQGLGGRFVERIAGDYDNVVGLPGTHNEHSHLSGSFF